MGWRSAVGAVKAGTRLWQRYDDGGGGAAGTLDPCWATKFIKDKLDVDAAARLSSLTVHTEL
jgi:hypothetical protein